PADRHPRLEDRPAAGGRRRHHERATGKRGAGDQPGLRRLRRRRRRDGRRRGDPVHGQPQLPRPDGQLPGGDLPRQPRRGGRHGGPRGDHRPQGTGRRGRAGGDAVNPVEKILARASGRRAVTPGEIVVADVACLLLHDLSGYLTARVFEKEVGRPVRYPDRVVMVFDHHFSPPSEERAVVLEENRAFARRHGIRLFDCGSGNIHHVGVRNGFVRPGTVIVGSDSHTPVHGTLGCFAAGLGNNSHAGMVMPFGKAWFRVPETVRIELSGRHDKAVTPRDAALWLTGQIGEGGAVYRALHFAGEYIDELDVWD